MDAPRDAAAAELQLRKGSSGVVVGDRGPRECCAVMTLVPICVLQREWAAWT